MKITNDWIYTQLSKRQTEHLGAVWNNKERTYRLPNTLGVLRDLYRLYPTDSLRREGIEKRRQRDKLLSLKRLEDAPGREELRPYQRVDVGYLMGIGSAGIFNQQRTGK